MSKASSQESVSYTHLILRHGKVCTEGWWQPYAPGKRHTCHSLTKTYMGTAVGIAIREGLLSLDDKLVDIFPEYQAISTISNVTVRHILCMGSGVTSMPAPSEQWVRDFFLQPQVHEPGTAFFYNSAGSTLLAYVIERVSGTPVYDYQMCIRDRRLSRAETRAPFFWNNWIRGRWLRPMPQKVTVFPWMNSKNCCKFMSHTSYLDLPAHRTPVAAGRELSSA